MTSALHKRLARLEELLAARVSPPIWKWMPQCVDAAAELEHMVADGEIAEKDKGRVQIWRWLTREEALARGIVHPEPPPPKPAPALPAPPAQAAASTSTRTTSATGRATATGSGQAAPH